MKMSLAILYIALTFWFCGKIIPASCSGNQTDQPSLVRFRNAIDHDRYGTLSSWNNANFCDWQGVSCSKRHPGRVIDLDLGSKGLVGSLTPHIGNLSFLRTINLKNNSFYGRIPEDIGQLFRLRKIELSNNTFSGEIPTNLSHCKSLIYLGLTYNKLVGKIPVQLGSLTKLETLYLSSNSLSHGNLPSSLGNLTNLREISLTELGLQGQIPTEFSQLRNLVFLQLSFNNLTGEIPSGVFNISAITYFAMMENKLHGTIPSDIGLTLPNLLTLDLSYNEFEGKVPPSLSNISALRDILLAENYFTGLVPKDYRSLSHLRSIELSSNQLADDVSFLDSLTNCTSLEEMAFSYNFLRGSLPKSLANLSSTIQSIALSNNRLQATIPPGIENLVNLRFLHLANNDFTGLIPVGISKLHKLQVLNLRRNKLEGEIPSSIGNLTLLSTINLGINNLSGSIPPSVGSCFGLLKLDLYHNHLHGSIPREVISLSSLSILVDLSTNLLSGPLPSEIGSLKNLAQLDLSDNRLSGTIPSALGECTVLGKLYLQGNLFEGNIPLGLGNLKGLRELDISHNNLSGQIPDFLSKLSGLSYLNVSWNRLQGEIPKGGIFSNSTSISILGNNDLCGGIPELKLRPCVNPTAHKSKLPHSVKVSILVLVSAASCLILLAAFIILCYQKRKSRKEDTSTLSPKHQFLRISYGELFNATDGFSEDNMIGLGSYGSVYKGVLEQGEREIAVKVLNLRHRGASRSFMSECEALRNTKHRNLLKLLSVCSSIDFQANDFKALVYEYMPNGSLDKWLHPCQSESRSLKLKERLSIAFDIASAIEYLHNDCPSTIVHGDLKPNNVLLDEDMTAHVGDFGLAKIMSTVSGETTRYSSSSIGIKGSIGYVAPEYGMTQQVSTQGDVYSYGILLLEMFTGKKPTDTLFQGDLNLHIFVERFLPDGAMEIADPTILSGEDGTDKIKNCIANVLRIGVTCSKESPRDRMKMGVVVRELAATKRIYERTRT